MWSLNVYGEELPPGAALLITALCNHIGASGTFNISDRPQVRFGQDDPHSKPAMGTPPQEEAHVSDEETTEAEEAPEAGGEAAGDEAAGDEAAAGDETAAGEAEEAAHGAFAGATVESLEAELNRRSAEGASVTSDGSPLQEASAADIEAEIQKLQDASVAAPTTETETE